MRRYQFVTKLGIGVLLAGLVFAPGAALADEVEIGAAAKVGESLGGLHLKEQPDSGSGEFTGPSIEMTEDLPGDRVIPIEILTENELSVDSEAFAGLVLDVLNDAKGWGSDGSVSFELVEDDPELTIRLATPGTVDDLCAPLNTDGYTSCRVADEVILNVDRWAGATDDFLDAGGSLSEYRIYLINHEVGHFLGHGHETECGSDGLAPVMMQQTLDLRGCEPNGWPDIP